MKKKWKIIFIVLGIVIVALSYFGYQTYLHIAGNERLGNQGEIPQTKSPLLDISKDEADWPHWRGPNYNGKSNIQGIKLDWSKGLDSVWSVDFLCQDQQTASWSSVVVQGNHLIVPGRDENHDLLFCLNAKTGALIWKGSYLAEAGTSHGPGPRATPIIENDKVYSFGRSGDLVCWNLLNGEIIWRRNVTEVGGEESPWGYSANPYIFEDKVIVQGGGSATIQAYNKTDGQLLWTALEGQAGYSGGNEIELDHKKYLVLYHGLGLSLIEPTDGNVLWTLPYETDYGVNATTPLILGNKIFHASNYGMGAQYIEVDVSGFRIIHKNEEFDPQHSDPIHIDGYVYGYVGQSGKRRGEFMCLELESGKIMWRTNEIGQGTTIYADGHLICLDLKGNLHLINPNPNEFNKIGEIRGAIPNVRHLAWTVPVIANGKLYLRYLQHLICYDIMR